MDGLAVDEAPLGVSVDAGVTVNGTKVLMFCWVVVEVNWCVGDGDGQHLLPVLAVGDIVAEGGI